MMEATEQISLTIINTLLTNPKMSRTISRESRIVEDLSLDSLAVMNFVMEVEDRFDVSVPLDRLSDIHTINDLASCICDLKRAGDGDDNI